MSKEQWVLIWIVFLWQQICQLTGQTIDTPPNFPPNIAIRRDDFQNWSREITVKCVWIATPKIEDDVPAIANWAYAYGFVVRALGFSHGFAPFVVTMNTDTNKTILVDMTQYLIHMEMTSSPTESAKAVKVQTGASMENLLAFLEENDCGMSHVPAPGQITVGGVLAVGAHGAGIVANGDVEPPGLLFGTISNSIKSLTAVVWNGIEYVLKTFDRSDPIIRALLIHLGRSFITEVTMSVGKNYYLRCQSYFDVNSKELYAAPGNYTPFSRTFSSYVDQTGRIDALTFGDSDLNWVKVWNVSPIKPFFSRKVNEPYNYVFGSYIPEPVADLYSKISAGAWYLTPTLAITQHALAYSTTAVSFSEDIWGWSKNTMLYVEPITLRETASGHVVITKRENIQAVVSIFAEIYGSVQKEYAKVGQYPIGGHMETRVTSVDRPVLGEIPYLTQARPIPGYPEYNLAVWLAISSQIDQFCLHEAMTKIESLIFERFPMNSTATDPIGFARAEWAKGYAYTKEAGWSNDTVLKEIIPATYPEWNLAIEALNLCDPHFIFANEFARRYFVAH